MRIFKPVLAWLSKAMYQPLWFPAPVRPYKLGASKPSQAPSLDESGSLVARNGGQRKNVAHPKQPLIFKTLRKSPMHFNTPPHYL